MPGMDGYQATAQIRTDPRFTHAKLPIIAITAHALADDREKAMTAGLNDYVTKPIDATQLTNTLLRWLAPKAVISHSQDKNESASSSVLPAALGAIDTKSALARLGDKHEFYLRLLLLFRDNHADTAQSIRSAMKDGDLPLARRLAHTLKGLAAKIGADKLSLAAKNLEAAIVQNNFSLSANNLEQVDQEFALVIATIASIIQTVPASDNTQIPTTHPNYTTLESQLNQLAHLLLSSDANATALISNLLQQPYEASLLEKLKALERIIKSYDFEKALKELDNLRQKLHIPSPKNKLKL